MALIDTEKTFDKKNEETKRCEGKIWIIIYNLCMNIYFNLCI